MNNFLIFSFFIVIIGACSQENVANVDDNVAQENIENNSDDVTTNNPSDQTSEQDQTTVEENNNVEENLTTETEEVTPDPEPDPNSEPSEDEDTVPPSDPSIQINSNEYTENSSVTLNLAALDATEMYITNDPNCAVGGSWEPYTTTKDNWTLGEMNIETRVYVKYQDEAENETDCVSDSIIHDQNAPTDPDGIDDGAYTITTTDSPSISWMASTDNESEVAYYEVSIGTSPGETNIKIWTNVGNVTTVDFNDLNLATGLRYFANIRAVDLLGNTSNPGSSAGFFYNYCYSIDNNDAWVFVPGDEDYATDDFCVMKYEAKNVNNAPASLSAGIPWTSINQGDAKTECSSLGTRFHLLTNPEWMTITANMTNVTNNWSGAAVGSGAMFTGHSDNDPSRACQANADDLKSFVKDGSCTGLDANTAGNGEAMQRRTHTLSYGNAIWDLSGNVREWIDKNESSDKPSIGGGNNPANYNEFTVVAGSSSLALSELIPTNGVKAFWVNSWNSTQRIGRALIGTNGSGGAMTRGGGFSGGDRNGLFRTRLDQPSSQTVNTLGFRCAYDIP
ncbi:MAG: hypothetical protein AB8G05_18245 [Oligoflexales bacterium]